MREAMREAEAEAQQEKKKKKGEEQKHEHERIMEGPERTKRKERARVGAENNVQKQSIPRGTPPIYPPCELVWRVESI